MGEVELPSWLKTLPQAPEYHPTEAEFADPVAYILKVEEEAKQYGICKIIPPFTKASKKVVINNLNRSLSLSTEALSSTVHGACGASMSRSMGGVMLGAELAKQKGLFLDASCPDSSNKAKFATRRQQLGWNPKRARGVAHSQNHKLVWQSGESYTLEQFEQKSKMFARSRLGTGKDMSPLAVESLFWRAAAEKPISVEYANDIPGSAFADPARLRKRKRALEDAEQVNLESIFVGCQSDEKAQEDETGEELDPSDAAKPKNGAQETGGDNVGGAGSKLANSAWNMRIVARSQGSLLQFMPEEVPGVTSPMVYIGMLFSWFAWHVEDHELHSLNYLHTGASKTWYAVPGDAAPALEEAIRIHGYGGHLDPRAAFSLLGEKTTVMSPEVLVAAGVPCCRLVQNAGEYVVTFPRAYHLGFSHGFNCGEAANFATPGWLEVAKEAAARRAAMNYLPMLSHQQLLYLLTMSLPLRMPASAPSEPRSSRLKVRKKSVGEEMVKSVFLQDAVHNNGLLRVLLDNGVSRCLLAKDAVHHRSPNKAMSEGSKLRSPLPPLDDLERALISELSSQGGGASQFPCPGAGNGEETDNHCQSQLPSWTPVTSGGHDAVFGDLSMASFGETKFSCQSNDQSLNSLKSAMDDAPQELDGTPIHSKNSKEITALSIDWGTLPCSACGILCYATMAVVEPSEAAAMTFKPIYAAAGLGHCAFEAHDNGRMAQYLPGFPFPRSSPGPEFSDDRFFNPMQNADGRMKPGMLLELPNSTALRQQVVVGDAEFAKHALSTAHQGYPFHHQLTKQLSEEVDGNRTISPTSLCEGGHAGDSNLQTTNVCLGAEMKAGGAVNIHRSPPRNNCNNALCVVTTEPELLCQEELGVAVDCAANLGPPAGLDSVGGGFRSGNLDDCDRKDSFPGKMCSIRAPSEQLAPPPLSHCHTTDAKIIGSYESHPLECQVQPQHISDNSTRAGVDGGPDAAEQCGEQNPVPVPKPRGVVSSLQLLASAYEENSDLEDEEMGQPVEWGDVVLTDEQNSVDDVLLTEEHNSVDDVLTEEQNSVDDDDEAADGGGVFAKPHRAVGELLTDEVGLAADVPWLSLVPATEPVDLPPLTSEAPLFTFANLVEGPTSLKNVFISGGFSFKVDDDTADPASLGSSLTEERSGKQGSEATSVDGDPNNLTSDVHGGDNRKVFDMQELYQRINSQALTVDSDDDEQLMIDFGRRRPLLDVEECKNDGIERAASPPPHSMEVKNEPQVGKHLTLASDATIYVSLGMDNNNPSCPLPTNFMGTAPETPFRDCDASHAVAKTVQQTEDASVGGRMSMASVQDAAAGGAQWKDHNIPGTLPYVAHERRQPAAEACKSGRPRVLCLEHAVEAQERLRSVGGANVLIVCHADFNDYEVRGKQLTEEFGVEHDWRHIPFAEGTEDEVRMVSTAVDVEDEDRRVNDWVMQMGLFVHHRFKERDSESSDDAQNANEDFRAGPFSRVNQGNPSRNRMMAGRLGLSRKSDGHRRPLSGAHITVRYSRRAPKMSKKKKCTVAGKWCGKVWRVNQVHPFLGGCRTVDPSLQLGMPSTSLYALSMMSECNGGRHRRGISSSRIDASPNCHFIPDKGADDQQSIAVRNRVRKRKAVEQGLGFQQESGNDGQRRMPKSCPKNTLAVCTTGGLDSGDFSSSPKQRLLAESRDGSECMEGEELLSAGEGEGQLIIRAPPSVANQSDADPLLQSAKSDVTSLCCAQMLSPIPLATRNPSDTEDTINASSEGRNGEAKGKGGEDAMHKHLPIAELVGENECCGSVDMMKPVAYPLLSLPSDSQAVPGVNGLELSSQLSLKCIQSTETGRTVEDGDDWHKTSSLSNVYSAGGKGRNESSNVAKASLVDGSRICVAVSAESFVWRDVPVVCSPSFHDPASQFPLPLPSSIHSQLYIPYVGVSSKEAVSDHTLASQNSHSELYSGSSKRLGSCEQGGGGKLQGVQLLQTQNGEVGAAAEAGLDSCPPKASSSKPFPGTGTPVVYTEVDTSVQHVGSSKLAEVNYGKQQDPQMNRAHLTDEVLNSLEGAVPSLLDRVIGKFLGPNDAEEEEEDCRGGGSCEAPAFPQQGISEQQQQQQLVCESGGLQQSVQDIKNVVRIPDGGEMFATDGAGEGLADADHHHLRAHHHMNAGQSPSNDSDPVQQQLQDCHLYDSKQSIELTPVLSFSPSLIGEGALVGRGGDLGFADAMGQGSTPENPLCNLMPLRSSSRGRSAVKARGKRPKHVGWTNYKAAQSRTPGEGSVGSDWAHHQAHSRLGAPVIFTLQPKECVEARFEVDDCDRVLEIPDEPTSPTCPASTSGLNQVAADEEENDGEASEPEKVVPKSKKKAKAKKKRVPVGKPVVDDGDFLCDIDGCRMSFPTDSDLQIHKRNRCTFKGCGKQFFMHKYLLQHRRVHLDERPLKCPWKGCKQAFKWAWARTEHIRVHTGERPYACPDCEQTFRFVSDFSRHKRNTGHTKS